MRIYTIILLLSTFLFSCKTDNNSINDKEIINKKVDSLLNIMTLDEKIGQMNQYNGFWDVTGPSPKNGDAKYKYDNLKKGLVGSMLNVRGVKEITALQKIVVEETRLGIPLIIGNDVIHGYKTLSPIPLAEAASWDLEEIENSARVAALEASAAGTNWTFAPMVDISRDARWGRVMEGAGEDPYLGSLVAALLSFGSAMSLLITDEMRSDGGFSESDNATFDMLAESGMAVTFSIMYGAMALGLLISGILLIRKNPLGVKMGMASGSIFFIGNIVESIWMYMVADDYGLKFTVGGQIIVEIACGAFCIALPLLAVLIPEGKAVLYREPVVLSRSEEE